MLQSMRRGYGNASIVAPQRPSSRGSCQRFRALCRPGSRAEQEGQRWLVVLLFLEVQVVRVCFSFLQFRSPSVIFGSFCDFEVNDAFPGSHFESNVVVDINNSKLEVGKWIFGRIALSLFDVEISRPNVVQHLFVCI